MNVDCVVDATGRYRRRHDMEAHLRAGAKRVILASLPSKPIDRIVIPGINEGHATGADKMISAGSATTNAFALLLQFLDQSLGVDYASLTTVHAYSSDQSLQDYAHEDFRSQPLRRKISFPTMSRRAGWKWFCRSFGNSSGYALNVPVQRGSLLDVNCVMHDGTVTVDQVNDVMRVAAARASDFIGITDDPIVSIRRHRLPAILALRFGRDHQSRKEIVKCSPCTRAWGMRAACSTWSGNTASLTEV